MISLKFLTLIIFLSITTGCAQERLKTKKIPHVVVSIPPYLSLVQEIAGETVTVTSVIDLNFDPHTSEITPMQIKKIQNANLFIGIGELYENNLVKALSKKKQCVILKLNEIVPLLCDFKQNPLFPSTCHNDQLSPDPHFYLSPKRLIFQVKALVAALSHLNPQHTFDYGQKEAVLIQRIQLLDQALQEKLSPYTKRGVLISHAALTYFCHDYDLIQIATEYEGKSPLPKDVWAIYQIAKHSNPICAFIIPQFNNKGMEIIAQQLNLRIESFNPIAENVLETIEHIGNSLTKCP